MDGSTQDQLGQDRAVLDSVGGGSLVRDIIGATWKRNEQHTVTVTETDHDLDIHRAECLTCDWVYTLDDQHTVWNAAADHHNGRMR